LVYITTFKQFITYLLLLKTAVIVYVSGDFHSGLLLPKTIWLSNILALSVHNEGYSRNGSCALNLISTFYFFCLYLALSLFSYIFRWNKDNARVKPGRWVRGTISITLLINMTFKIEIVETEDVTLPDLLSVTYEA
jgi:hypothetical protein